LRNAAFLSLQQFLALDHHQRAIQVPDLRFHPRRAHLGQLASQGLHRASLGRLLQRLFRRRMSERQRDQAVV
jgi:hypothetical protein